MGRRRRIAVGLAVFALAGPGAEFANAELSVSGDLFVTFTGGIGPNALPRRGRAPITVSIAGKVRTLDGKNPPTLREMVIKLNSQGKLETRGLPTCRRGMVQSRNTADALAACRDALVGTGAYVARTVFPEGEKFSTHGRILAFNTVAAGHPAVLAHVFSSKPAPVARTFVFAIHHSSGGYGTVLVAHVPPSLNRYGYLKRISLKLHRTYAYRGREHSYLSAGCPAPAGVREASFNFAFASMTFADERVLSATLTRTCRASDSGP